METAVSVGVSTAISTHTTHVGGDALVSVVFVHIISISTHTTHVGGDCKVCVKSFFVRISTHTTHVGGDLMATDSVYITTQISTHTTHVGGDSNFRQKHIRNCILHPPKFTKNFKAASILILFYHNIFIN